MEESEEEVDYVQGLKDLIKEEFVEDNIIEFIVTDNNKQRIEIKNTNEKEPWFTLELSDDVEEEDINDFEEISMVAINMICEIIDYEIAKEVDKKALLN